MIGTKVHHSKENSSYIQDLNPLIEEINSSTQAGNKEQNTADEFSNILDKIAARFSENLGFDFTSLLNPAATQAVQVEIAKVAQKQERTVGTKEQDQQINENVSSADENSIDEDKVKESKPLNNKTEQSTKTAQIVGDRNPGQLESAKAENHGEQEAVSVKVLPQSVDPKTLSAAQSAKEVKSETSELADFAEQAVEEAAPQAPQAKASEIKTNAEKSDNSKVAKEAKSNSETAAIEAEVSPETALVAEKLSSGSEMHSEKATKTAEQKEAVAKEASSAANSNAALLADLFLTSSFNNKDLTSQQNAATSQDIKNITEAVKDKIVSSMNNSLNNQSLNYNMGGSFTAKNASEKAETLREKLAQQPQMLRTFEKVENALKEAAKARDGKTISLKLDPANLGTVKVDVTLKDGALHARLHADSQTVSTLLRDYSQDLQLALRKLGLGVDRITVAVNGSEYSETAETFSGNFSNQMSDKEDRQKTGSNAGFDKDFGLISEAAVKIENKVYDHWVA